MKYVLVLTGLLTCLGGCQRRETGAPQQQEQQGMEQQDQISPTEIPSPATDQTGVAPTEIPAGQPATGEAE